MPPPPPLTGSTSIIGVPTAMPWTVGSVLKGTSPPATMPMSTLVPPTSMETRSSMPYRSFASLAQPTRPATGPEL